jgi:hypothetical protein
MSSKHAFYCAGQLEAAPSSNKNTAQALRGSCQQQPTANQG